MFEAVKKMLSHHCCIIEELLWALFVTDGHCKSNGKEATITEPFLLLYICVMHHNFFFLCVE